MAGGGKHRQHSQRLRKAELHRAVRQVHCRSHIGQDSVKRRNHSAQRQKANFFGSVHIQFPPSVF